ncbi:S8 family peptidase [Flavobacterium sp. DSR3-2]|uniref:S8 family peptidase n=1 Tax=Flavobacterium sp. DSR3-2 TaxID=2804634 RepID=UPI003CE76B5F
MNRHVFLNNDKSDSPKFNRQRNVGGDKKVQNENIESVESNEPKIIQEFQKERLRSFNAVFFSKRKSRNENRTIEFPSYIDLIKIKFYNIFNNEASGNYKLKLKEEFYRRYGLFPIEYKDFNKTVVFEIVDNNLFEVFKRHLKIIIESSNGTSYQNKEYSLIALIYEFEFIDTKARLDNLNEENVMINLISSSKKVYNLQKDTLFGFLSENNLIFSYSENSPDIIEIKDIPWNNTEFIADNFDIVQGIVSSRVEKIRPGYLGPIREYGFEVEVEENITIVGVIDTGVEKIEPLRSIILEESIDHTASTAFWDEVGHGTLVAGLVALGDDFYKDVKSKYYSKAKIFVIKVLQQDNDSLDIPRLLADIRFAKRQYGIRIFNMSLVIPNAKKYNETYSQFAYELDKLAFEEDLLVFISVGNFNDIGLKELVIEEPHLDHEYPDFFYKLNSSTDIHKCENTNICVPSESLNNISVGALAGNLEKNDCSDVTPNALYPAYYSRKFHYDLSQKINTQKIKQKNKHLNKPDFVFEGGDLFDEKAGIEILRSAFVSRDKFFGKTCGTSLATPLVTSYAAEILNSYPKLRTQTVKALLVNSAKYVTKSKLPHFKNKPDSLLKSLIGFGKPSKEELILNYDNSITFIIEDNINVGEIMKIPIELPKYLKKSGNKLQFDISLCFSFMPIKDNQLDYLPLHISFNIVQNKDIEDIAFGVAKKNADTPQEKVAYGIKNFPWSEDHFGIDTRLISNAQFMTYKLQPNDYDKIDDSLAIAVRCLAKKEHFEKFKNSSHPFSIVIKITEILSNENGSNLYSEMLEINNFLEIDSNLNTELEAEN